MLREHLSQDHDSASRRTAIIDVQVEWLIEVVLDGAGRRILDLGCGPGLYSKRFAARGHTCVGIDLSPASIEYARSESPECEYILGDVRTAPFGAGYDCAMFIFGELNAFPREQAVSILRRAAGALNPGGQLVIEVHEYDYLHTLGHRSPTWRGAESSVFADVAHVCLHEHFWNEFHRAAIERYFVIEATQTVSTFVSTAQAYELDEYQSLLRDGGFTQVDKPTAAPTTDGLFFLVAKPS
jgi:SAM-dependent methyltransferase